MQKNGVKDLIQNKWKYSPFIVQTNQSRRRNIQF